MNFEGAKNMGKRAALRKEQPDAVKRAISENDTHLLSHFGRKGAMQANDNREARKAFDERIADRRRLADEALKTERNEHIVPLNPDEDSEREAA